MEPKVSIILPVYNADKYLERCIDSIIRQTYKNLEIIAIDDGSVDNSYYILENYANKYPHIMRVYKQQNMGVSNTRNKAIQLATGEYIMFIDNDDFFDKDYVMTFVNCINKNNLDVVIGGYRRPDSKGNVVENIRLVDTPYSRYKIVAAWAKIYRLDYIKNNKIEFLVSNIGEDIFFTIQAVNLTKKIKVIDYVGYNWFYNKKSVSLTKHKKMNKDLQFSFMLNQVYECLQNKDIKLDDYLEYYFIKLNIWYILYSSKKVEYKIVKDNFKNNFLWLEEKFPDYKNNKFIKINKPKGEDRIYTFLVWIIIKMINMKLIYPFLWIYCKV